MIIYGRFFTEILGTFKKVYLPFYYLKILFKYAIVFDAGSSGTRMFIYEWDSMYQPEQGKRLLVNQVLNCNTDGSYYLEKIKLYMIRSFNLVLFMT